MPALSAEIGAPGGYRPPLGSIRLRLRAVLHLDTRTHPRRWAGRLLVAGIVATTLLAASLAAPPAGSAKAKRSVACFKSPFPEPGTKPSFREKPKNCVYIDKGALDVPVPPTRAVQATRRVGWTQWGGRRASGRGRAYSLGAGRFLPARVVLSRPVKKCGHKTYTRVTINFSQYNFSVGPFTLSTC